METLNNIPDIWKKLIEVFIDRNGKINLSAIREPHDIYTKHILDALEIKKLDIPLWNTSSKTSIRWADLWTWWWFPLLPLAQIYPQCTFVWIDARHKKIKAINQMIKALWYTNCKAIHARAEEHKTTYDIITARAVAYFDKLFPWIDRLLKPGGTAILYKMFTPEEDQLITKICRKHLRNIEKKHHYTLPWDEVERCLYVFKKKKLKR